MTDFLVRQMMYTCMAWNKQFYAANFPFANANFILYDSPLMTAIKKRSLRFHWCILLTKRRVGFY